MPKVSVVIPSFNAMRYLPRTLETVLEQTFDDFEVIIVNDGSTDNIKEWFEGIEDPRVKLISQPNRGLAEARNTGIKNARGEYIALLDADDLWETTKLEKQVRCIEENPEIGMVYTWTALTDNRGCPTGTLVKSYAEGNIWQELLVRNVIACGSNPLIRRDCFTKVGLFSPDVPGCEDRDMWIRIAYRYPIVVVKEPLVLYRQQHGSMSNNCYKMLENNRIVIEKAFQLVPTAMLPLRNRSYGLINLYLGWKALQNSNYKQAQYFRSLACAHLPQLYFSPNYLRLGMAIALLRWLGPNPYNQIVNSWYVLRQTLAKATR